MANKRQGLIIMGINSHFTRDLIYLFLIFVKLTLDKENTSCLILKSIKTIHFSY